LASIFVLLRNQLPVWSNSAFADWKIGFPANHPAVRKVSLAANRKDSQRSQGSQPSPRLQRASCGQNHPGGLISELRGSTVLSQHVGRLTRCRAGLDNMHSERRCIVTNLNCPLKIPRLRVQSLSRARSPLLRLSYFRSGRRRERLCG
jgi:hypothetical protein